MTVASPIPIAELATRWYALTVENAPKLDMSLRLEVENYCSGDPWAGNPTSQAMGSILAEDQDLRDQLDSLLGTSYKAVGTAMLLMWSLTQNKNKSWPHAASARDTIARWDESDVLWTEGAPDRNRVQHVLNFTLPLAHTMALETRAEFFHSIYDKVMPFLPMLARNQAKGEEARKRADLYVALGHCALQAVALGPLLAWASRQEWADEVAWEDLLTAARRRLGCRPPGESVAAMLYALRVMQPMHSLLAPERRAVVLDTWLQPSVLWQVHRWTNKGIYQDMAQAWVCLGLLAEQTPTAFGSPAPLLRWQAVVKDTLYAVMPHEQTSIIKVLLGSALSDRAKVLASCAGDPEGLDDPEVVRLLSACLDSDEAIRISQLAWASPAGSRHKSGSPRTYMPHEAMQVNTRMVQAFCPTLYGMLACVVPPKAWAEKHLIAEHVKAFLDPAAQDVLALPADLDLEEVAA